MFCLFEMHVNVFFLIRCLYSGMSLTLVREQRFIIIISSSSIIITLSWNRKTDIVHHTVAELVETDIVHTVSRY